MLQNWRPSSNLPLQKSSLKHQVSKREAAGSICSSRLRSSPETRCYWDRRRNPGAKRRAAQLDQPRFHRVLLPPCGQRCELEKRLPRRRTRREGKERQTRNVRKMDVDTGNHTQKTAGYRIPHI